MFTTRSFTALAAPANRTALRAQRSHTFVPTFIRSPCTPSISSRVPTHPASGSRVVVCRGLFDSLLSGFRSDEKINAGPKRMSTYTPPAGSKQATLGGGCFWCLEACYQQLKGVHHVESGYAGGQVPNPTYEQVCAKNTGHAEVVQVTYDPDQINFKDLLNVFFVIHDPTTPNRQGNDVGPQYRSIILYHDEEQKAASEEVIQKVAQEEWFGSKPIVTQVVPLNDNYYPAERYHQNYYRNNPGQGYCAFVVGPKVQKFRSKFFNQLKA